MAAPSGRSTWPRSRKRCLDRILYYHIYDILLCICIYIYCCDSQKLAKGSSVDLLPNIRSPTYTRNVRTGARSLRGRYPQRPCCAESSVRSVRGGYPHWPCRAACGARLVVSCASRCASTGSSCFRNASDQDECRGR